MEGNLQIIQSKIREFRGKKIILDFELAELYGVETKVL
ncbi:ORF6N domain-containing protein, partial [Culturomica massiliensis]